MVITDFVLSLFSASYHSVELMTLVIDSILPSFYNLKLFFFFSVSSYTLILFIENSFASTELILMCCQFPESLCQKYFTISFVPSELVSF